MMHPFKTSLIVIAMFLSSASSQAFGIIGETPQQCEARYGKPTEKDPDGSLIYRQFQKKMGMMLSVWVHFIDGKAAKVRYQMSRNEGAQEISVPLQFEMKVVNALLLLNDPDDNWEFVGEERDEEEPEDLRWRNEPLHVSAELLIFSLDIYTDEYAKKR